MRKRQNFIWRGILLFLCAALLVVIVGCSKKDQEEVKVKKSQGKKQFKTKEEVNMEDNKIAVIETNKGTIKFKFYPKEAPKTVKNFIKLANEGFYDGTKFHRVVPGFVIQGGDPNSKDDDPSNNGQGGPGYTIPAEFNDHKHIDGTVAMARKADPDSAGSQFYICLDAQPHLDGQYTVFGQVTEGLDIVHKIEQYDVMKKVYIEK